MVMAYGFVGCVDREISDLDGDGLLDDVEFAIAM